MINKAPLQQRGNARMIVIVSLLLFGFTSLLTVLGYISYQAHTENQNLKEVLAEETSTVTGKGGGEISFNMPSMFNEDVYIDSEATISGNVRVLNKNLTLGTGALTASNVIYGLIAGDNISISGGQTPTISASVSGTTLNGQSGDLTLVGGEGITIAGLTISNDDPGSAQNIFKTINAGGTNITAGSNNDTLNIQGGSGISISASDKTITINNTQSGGGGGGGITTVSESNTPVVTAATALDFLGGDFDVSQAPSGQANVTLASTLSSVTGVAGAFSTGSTLTVGSSLTLGGETVSDLTGSGLVLTSETLGINLTTTGGAGLDTSNSGLEVGANGLTLLKGCNDAQILAWDDVNEIWECVNQSGGGGGGITTLKNNNVTIGTTFDTLNFSSLFTVTEAPANQGNVTIAANSLNFTEFSNALTLDAATTITNALAANLTIDLTSTGDFVISDNGTPFFTFTDAGALTQAGAGQVTFTGNVDATNGLDVTGASFTVGGTNATITTAGVITGTTVNSTGALQTAGTDRINAAGNLLNIAGVSTSLTPTAANTYALGTSTANQYSTIYGQNLFQNGNTVCDTTGNCAGTGGGSQWQRNGTVLSPYTVTDQVVIGGNTTTAFQLEVSGNRPGKALASLNETGDQNILTASASGTTVFNLNRNGNIQFAGNTGFMNTITSLAGANQTINIPNLAGSDTVCFVNLGNCAGSGGGITGSGTAGQIAFFNGTNAITSEISGFSWDATNNRLGIGTNAPTGMITVDGASTGKALAVFNETGDQNIITASASGTTVANLDRNGNLAIIGQLSNLTDNTLTVNDNLNLVSGNAYQINGTSVLNATTLGTTVVNSSLTGVGALTSGSIASGFGTILTANTIQGTDITASGTTGYTASGNGAGLVFSGTGTHNLSASSGTLQLGAVTLNGAVIGNNQNITGLNNLTATGGVNFTPSLTNDIVLVTDADSTINITGLQTGTGNALCVNGTFDVVTCTVGSGGVSGSGTAGQITYFNGTSSVTSEASGFAWDATNDRLGLGTNTPDGKLHVTGANVGKALAIFNETGNQNIIAASGSGTTVFTLDTSGNLALEGQISDISQNAVTFNDNVNLVSGNVFQINNTSVLSATTLGSTVVNSSLTSVGTLSTGVWNATVIGTQYGGLGANVTAAGAGELLYSTGTTTYGHLAAGSTGQCLTSGGAGAPTWATCATGAAGVNYWQQNLGALSPINSTLDLLVGGTASNAAKFAVLNMNNGTPTASLSAGTAGGAYLTADGKLATTNKQSLTLGDTATGDILINPTATSNVGVGTTTSRFKLQVGTGTVDSVNTATDLVVADASEARLGTVVGNRGTFLRMASGASTYGSLFSFDYVAGAAINTVINEFGGNLGVGNTSPAGKLDVAGAATGKALTILNETGDQAILTGSASGTTRFTFDRTGNLNIVGGAYQIGGTNVLSSTTLGSTVVNSSLTSVGTLSTGVWNATVIGTQYGGLGANVTAAGAGELLYSTGTTTYGHLAAGSTGQCLTSGGAGAPTWATCATGAAGVNYWQQNLGALSPINSTLDLLIGGTSSSSAKFAVLNVNTSNPTSASVSGTTGGAYLTSDGKLATTNKQALVLGDANTGNINVNSNKRINFFTDAGTTLRGFVGQEPSSSDLSLISKTSGGWLRLGSTGLGGIGFWTNGNADVDTSPQMFFNSAGQLGINALLPSALLDVNGTASVSGAFKLYGSSPTIQSTTNKTLTIGGDTTGNISLAPRNGNGTVSITGTGGLDLTGAAAPLTFSGAGNHQISSNSNLNLSAGVVEIGTPSLSLYKLTVAQSSATDAMRIENTNAGSTAYASINYGNGSTNFFSGLGGTGASNVANKWFVSSGIGAATAMVFDTSGNLGIGTYSPGSKLDVAGTADVDALKGAGLTDCDALGSKLLWDATTSLFSCGTDRASQTLAITADQTRNSTTLSDISGWSFTVGSGETWILDARMITSMGATPGYKLAITAPSTSECDYQVLDNFNNTLDTQLCGDADAVFTSSDGTYSDIFLHGTVITSGTGTTIAVRWANSVGTTTTTLRDGSYLLAYKVSGADVAELYYSKDHSVEAGDVIMGDSSLPAGVQKTNKPYDNRALGIASTKPGVVLGDDTPAKGKGILLALAGRVPVKVSSENGPIEPGDYITTSSKPGVAMKATKPGQMIGKAITSYDNSDTNAVGKIVVFANLSWADPTTHFDENGNFISESINNEGQPKEITMDASGSGNLDLSSLQASMSAIQDTQASQEGKLTEINAQIASLSAKIDLSSGPSAFTASSASDLNLDKIDANKVTISDSLNVLGKTTVGDLGITGNLVAGVVSLHGLEGELNTLSGPLKLQANGLNGIEMVDGKVKIAKNGDIETKGEITAKKYNVETKDVAGASLGEATLPEGKTKIDVETSTVTSSSAIFLTPKTKLAQPLSVTKQDPGKSFTVEIEEALNKDIKFNWWIVN